MSYAKTGDLKQDKILGNLSRTMTGMQSKVRVITGSVKTEDVSEGEFLLSSVPKDSESPGSPVVDEGRMYFKVDGILYQLSGIKVGG
jgi:hypothetical protein